MSLFVDLLVRSIGSEFFNNLFSVEELSKLQWSCKRVQKIVLHWKEKFDCLEAIIGRKHMNKNLLSFVKSMHKTVKKVRVTDTMSAIEYHYVTLIKNVEELEVNNLENDGLLFLTSSMSSLTKLTLSRDSTFVTSLYFHHFDSITLLSNLNTLTIERMHYFDDNSGSNFHKLKLLTSFNILDQPFMFKTDNNFISKLTSLTKLSINNCGLDNQELSNICKCCQAVEDLDVRNNFLLTSAGLSYIQRLNKIHSIHFSIWSISAFEKDFEKLGVSQIKDCEKLGQEKGDFGPELFWGIFKSISTLTSIDLGGSHINEADLAEFSHQQYDEADLTHLKLFDFILPELRYIVFEDTHKKARTNSKKKQRTSSK
jgi:hypothetical protein